MRRVHGKLASIGILALGLAFIALGAGRAFGQDCPRSDVPPTASRVRTLEGQLVFHDDIRRWFELKLDQPQCGQRSVQVLALDDEHRDFEIFRGCRVRSTGALDLSTTGYFSLDIYQDVESLEPVGACSRQPPFPDHASAKPDARINAYRVEMHVIYGPGDHPVGFRVRSAGQELQPWQAYASYWLTGGFALYGHCGEGFVIDEVFGTPEADPGHFDEPRTETDRASFDPETAAASGVHDLNLGYTCIRAPLPAHE